jgi:enoyl-CoA hydratase
MSAPVISLERRGFVAVVTINRPERRNAFDRATADAMEAVIDEFEQDTALRVAVITGSNGVFSAGQDLKAAARGELARSSRRGGFGIMADPPTKPVIAAVEGHAVGGGLELCLACDLIVAARDAKMGLPEARRGLPAMGGGLFRLPKRIPYQMAMEMSITGTVWSAEELQRFGLINRLAEPGEALDVAVILALEIANCGPVAVRASKAIVSRCYDWPDAECWERQRAFVNPVMESEDYAEGLAAFAERREPVWKGR